MSPDRWGRIDELYHATLERQPSERDVFLASACQGDGELRQEVESLLAQKSGSLLDGPAWEQAPSLVGGLALASGAQIGPYCVIGVAGTGGQGEVYRASDSRLRRDVAIKVLPEHLAKDPHARARFEHEARAIAALNHPHICQIYDVGPDYIVMEFVDGAPLKGPLPLKKAVEYAGQILDALDAAHRKGITHRDLKPGNILVTKQGIKLLDFGLAKQSGPLKETDCTLTAALTGQGQIVGTLQYMSPEQLHGKEADARSDLFSFGCVLYEMLTGRRAFEGESAASVTAAILEREPGPFDISPPLERVIRTCLAKDPDQRFQSALDLKRALTGTLDQPPTVAKPRRGWWTSVTAALTLAAVGGWTLGHFNQPPANDGVVSLQINPPDGGAFIQYGGVALSPDGRYVTYVAAASGKPGLWVRSLDSSSPRLLAGTEGATFPFWSPDNRSIAFFAKDKLHRVDLEGGAPVTICDAILGTGGAWSSDGQILFGSSTFGLSQVSASGGVASPLTTLGVSEVAHRWPQMLPGGRFLYHAQSDRPENSGVFEASLANPGERRRLLNTSTNALYSPGGNGNGYLLWLRSGSLVAQGLDADAFKLAGEPHPIAGPIGRSVGFSLMNVAVSARELIFGSSDVLSQLTWLDRTGNPLGVVGEPAEYLTSRLSPDERHIVAVRSSVGVRDLWLLEVGRGLSSRFTSNGIHKYPIWSPDGKIIVFGSGTPYNLYRKEASGAGNEQRLTNGPNLQGATDWSRDGRWILYTENGPDTQKDLWVLPMTAAGTIPEGAKPRSYLRTPANESGGRFSPEQSPRWIAYQSDESGRNEVYVRAFPEPHGKFQISTAGGSYAQWGESGRELFYVSPTNRLMAVRLELGSDSVEPSAPRELFQLPSVDYYADRPYEVTADGRRFLVVAPLHSLQPLTVIVNWPALLKKSASQ